MFARNPMGVTLTPLAEELLPTFVQAFDQLGNAIQALPTRATLQKVKVAALPSFAQFWLAPRLGRLLQSAPEISELVIAMETPPNTTREPLDMTLFYVVETHGARDICIAPDRIFSVCAPLTPHPSQRHALPQSLTSPMKHCSKMMFGATIGIYGSRLNLTQLELRVIVSCILYSLWPLRKP